MTLDSAFTPACPREAFVETAAGSDALRRLDAGLGAREPFLLVTGEPGTGKTTVVREAVARWGARVAAACLAYPALTGTELLEEIVRRFGAEPAEGANRPRLMASLEHALAGVAAAGQVAMVVVDDAQQLSAEQLEELRLLVNAAQQAGRPFEVLLAGLPALEARLDEPALAALRQRVSVRARLESLGQGETRRYLRHRLDAIGADGAGLFPRKTCTELCALAHGLPRRINALAAESLRVAQTAGAPSVLPRHLHAAAASLWGEAAARAQRRAADAHAEGEDGSADVPDATTAPPAALAPTAAAAPAATAPVVAATAAAAPASAAVPAASASPPTRSPARSPAPAPVHASVPPAHAPASLPPAAAPTSAPAGGRELPAAGAPAPAQPASRAAHALHREPEPAPHPAPPTHHDPGEWVARFVGDRGPIRIGSQAAAHSTHAWDMREPAAPAEPAPARVAARPRAGTPPPALAPPLAAAPPAAPAATPRLRPLRAGRLRWATHAVLAASVVIAAALFIGRSASHRADAPARTTTAALAPPTGSRAEMSVPAPVVRVLPPPAERSKARVSESRTTRPKPAADGVSDIPLSSTGRYTLDVGSFPSLQAALDERDLVQRLTGIQAWVIPAEAGSDGINRVVLGVYRTRERAVAGAQLLLQSKTLPMARPAPLPPRDARL